jgi:preprotein translocase subunit YajC
MHRFFAGVAVLAVPFAAFAQNSAPAGNEQMASLLPFVFIFAIFYFLLIRPQQKRMKAHAEMVKAVKKGDEVVTAGGVVGKVVGLEGEDYALVQIASGVEIKVVKTTLSQVMVKPEAAKPAHQEKQSSAQKNDNKLPSKEKIANDN